MPYRLTEPNAHGGMTYHGDIIASLRRMAAAADGDWDRICLNLAADLLASHDDSGVSLDDWPWARRFVESLIGRSIVPSLL